MPAEENVSKKSVVALQQQLQGYQSVSSAIIAQVSGKDGVRLDDKAIQGLSLQNTWLYCKALVIAGDYRAAANVLGLSKARGEGELLDAKQKLKEAERNYPALSLRVSFAAMLLVAVLADCGEIASVFADENRRVSQGLRWLEKRVVFEEITRFAAENPEESLDSVINFLLEHYQGEPAIVMSENNLLDQQVALYLKLKPTDREQEKAFENIGKLAGLIQSERYAGPKVRVSVALYQLLTRLFKQSRVDSWCTAIFGPGLLEIITGALVLRQTTQPRVQRYDDLSCISEGMENPLRQAMQPTEIEERVKTEPRDEVDNSSRGSGLDSITPDAEPLVGHDPGSDLSVSRGGSFFELNRQGAPRLGEGSQSINSQPVESVPAGPSQI
eukprot:TRINITY_DN17898_c0_g2_i1.p1 TRINITY_DN17898_c0_g2~~TRINITY_DN17898_c0_g2_i1.p1  ORF type:complete len:385 (+),score=-44.96 TRINITY_DN17898_c0_g2_i1:14-1168(+)